MKNIVKFHVSMLRSSLRFPCLDLKSKCTYMFVNPKQDI